MQNYFDFRTLALATAVTFLVLFFFMYYTFRVLKTYGGFGYWTSASLFGCIGLLIIAFRTVFPDVFMVILPDICIVATLTYVVVGLKEFCGVQFSFRNYLVMPVAVALYHSYFTYWQPSLLWRFVGTSVVISLYFVYAAYIVRTHIPMVLHRTSLFLYSIFAVQAIWFVVRIIFLVESGENPNDVYGPAPVQGIGMLLQIAFNISTFAGLMTLNSQRAEAELRQAKEEITKLEGILPICTSCKKIRDDNGYWKQVETYISHRTGVDFSHGICPDCLKREHPDLAVKMAEQSMK